MSSPAPPRSILLVEDDEVFAGIALEVLKPLGSVTWAASAEEAMEVLTGRHWDLVIADIELPGMSGIDSSIVKQGAQPVVSTLVVSGRSGFQDAVSAIRAGADDY